MSMPSVSSFGAQGNGTISVPSSPLPRSDEYPLPNYSYSARAPSSSIDRDSLLTDSPYVPPNRPAALIPISLDQSPRDQSLQKRVSELTVERSEISARLFKQEKTNEELVAQNGLLRQRVSSFEAALGNAQLMQERVESLEAQNQGLKEAMEDLQRQQQQERSKWESTQSSMSQTAGSLSQAEEEKAQLQAKLMENLQTFQEVRNQLFGDSAMFTLAQTLDERLASEHRLQELLDAKTKEAESLQSSSQTLKAELKDLSQKLGDYSRTLAEKEQQLSILYKEGENRQRDNQINRDFLNQKNELIQKLQAQVASLSTERQTVEGRYIAQREETEKLKIGLRQLQSLLQQKEQELARSEENYSRLLNEKSIPSSGASPNSMQEMIESKVETMNRLQTRIEQLSDENQQLRSTVDQYQELLGNMQTTTEDISTTYEETITHLRAKHDEDMRRLLLTNNQLQSQIRASDSKREESEREDYLNHRFAYEVGLLEQMRAEHRNYKPSPTESIEEIQEKKIHQLLEEVNLMERLVEKVEVIDRVNALERVPRLESELLRLKEQLAFTRRERQSLLDAIETGDLSGFVLLQQSATEDHVEEAIPIKEPIETSSTEVEPQIPAEVPQKRGWFW
jgi:chromosome segregation ATPase